MHQLHYYFLSFMHHHASVLPFWVHYVWLIVMHQITRPIRFASASLRLLHGDASRQLFALPIANAHCVPPCTWTTMFSQSVQWSSSSYIKQLFSLHIDLASHHSKLDYSKSHLRKLVTFVKFTSSSTIACLQVLCFMSNPHENKCLCFRR